MVLRVGNVCALYLVKHNSIFFHEVFETSLIYYLVEVFVKDSWTMYVKQIKYDSNVFYLMEIHFAEFVTVGSY